MDVNFRHILVIDDDDTVRTLVSDMLSQMGLEVSSAENGVKGMDLFLKNRFDLVITDFDMPDMNGIELAKKIKKIYPHTSVILMTGRQKAEIQATLSGNSVDLTLFKPFSLVEFKDTIRKISVREEANFISNPERKLSKARTSDRRKELRSSCSESIYFTTKKRIHKGKLINKSPSGLFIEASGCFAEDETIITVVPCANGRDSKCKGRVIWCNQLGFGLELHNAFNEN